MVLKELVDCPENIFLTILVLDNILVNIWTILMFQGIKKSDGLNKLMRITGDAVPEQIESDNENRLHPAITIVVLVAAVLLANAVFTNLAVKVIFLSVIGLLLSNLIKRWDIGLVLKMGGVLILIVMAVLGLKLKFDLVEFQFGLLAFLIVWLVSHLLIMLAVAKLLNVNTAWVPIASMANVGGIATAPAVTAAYKKEWMPHAIILAILSMATGTFWGMLTIYLFRVFLVSS